MAAYRRVDGLVTCGLTACTPGSAPGPTLGNEYEKTLHLPFAEEVKAKARLVTEGIQPLLTIHRPESSDVSKTTKIKT